MLQFLGHSVRQTACRALAPLGTAVLKTPCGVAPTLDCCAASGPVFVFPLHIVVAFRHLTDRFVVTVSCGNFPAK